MILNYEWLAFGHSFLLAQKPSLASIHDLMTGSVAKLKLYNIYTKNEK